MVSHSRPHRCTSLASRAESTYNHAVSQPYVEYKECVLQYRQVGVAALQELRIDACRTNKLERGPVRAHHEPDRPGNEHGDGVGQEDVVHEPLALATLDQVVDAY